MSGFNELALIEEIRRATSAGLNLPIGIGDDAACLNWEYDNGVLVTIDTLMEGVHFDLDTARPDLVGRKALAVNLSDIAAMAGLPVAAVVGLSLPRSRGFAFASDLMRGVSALAQEFSVTLAGGDTNVWDGPAVISVTVLGRTTGGGPVARHGARSGDWLMVTGRLGGSGQGRHLTFRPRVQEAQELNQRVALHAMIDVSDGLATDLRHLLRESHAGAIIEANAIPVHSDVSVSLSPAERLRHALTDGEDFELLFTVEPGDGERLIASPPGGCCVTRIGFITDNANSLLMTTDKETSEVPWTGWEHSF